MAMKQFKSQNEVYQLCRTSAQRRYFNEIRGYYNNIKESNEELYDLYLNGNMVAKDKLIKKNLLFALSVAKKHLHKKYTLDDMIDDCNLGLINAIDCNKYDKSKGFKFLSFAVWYIRQAVMYNLNFVANDVRIPSNVSNDKTKINNLKDNHYKKFGYVPHEYDIKEELSLNDYNYKIATQNNNFSSINIMLNDDDNELSNLISNPDDVLNPDYKLLNNNKYQNLHVVINSLDEKSKYIILNYFGFNKKEEAMSLKEIGENIGLTKERVRQIKERTLLKIKQNKNFKKSLI